MLPSDGSPIQSATQIFDPALFWPATTRRSGMRTTGLITRSIDNRHPICTIAGLV